MHQRSSLLRGTPAERQPPARNRRVCLTASRKKLQARAIFTSARTANKDATAELLAAALNLGLQSRLKKHEGIEVDVQSTAMDLLMGRFGGMRVVGKQWRTPLQLTADTIEVAVGELLVDQSALMFQQRVALRNVPAGNCTFVLTPVDLGNFMAHPLLAQPAAQAVRGRPFHFNSSTVTFTRGADGTTGQVLYTGSCDVSGHTHMYSVSMKAPVAASTIRAISTGAQQRGGSSPASTPGPPGVHVTARRVHGAHMHPPPQEQQRRSSTPQQGLAAPPLVAASSGDGPSRLATPQHAQHEATADEAVVSEQLSALFSRLTLNMQGVQLSTPRLRLVPQSGPGSAPGSAAAVAHHGSPRSASDPLLLEIRLDLRLLELPPLNMKF